MSKLASTVLAGTVALVTFGCTATSSQEGVAVEVEPTDLSPQGIYSGCFTWAADTTHVNSSGFNTLRVGTSSPRGRCDYYIIEVQNMTGWGARMHSAWYAPVGTIVLQSQCEDSWLTAKYFGYIPAHLSGGMWVPEQWVSLSEKTVAGIWYNGDRCRFVETGFNIDPSPYTKIRAFTKVAYLDPQYVTQRGPVTTWMAAW